MHNITDNTIPPGFAYATDQLLLVPLAEQKRMRDEKHARRIKKDADDELRQQKSDADQDLKKAEKIDKKTGEWCNPPESCGAHLEIFDRAEVDAYTTFASENFSGSQLDEELKVIKGLKARGNFRALSELPWDWREQLDTLEQNWPNFSSFVQSVRIASAIAEKDSSRVLRLTPSIFCGPPGIGKTSFCTDFCGFFGSGPARIVRMETAQSSAAIVGSDASYNNTKVGVISEVILGSFANGVILLDEIEKCAGDDRFLPLTPLYSLLEPTSARDFRDLSRPFLKLDASHLQWIMTANSTESIPEPILSRSEVFSIPAPTLSQSKTIARSIVAKLFRDLPRASAGITFSDGAIDALCALGPRKMTQASRTALGTALHARRTTVEPGDVPGETVPTRQKMGFL